MIQINVAPIADDLLSGAGTELYEVFDNDFPVNSSTVGSQTGHQISLLSDGGYVVAWRSTTSSGEQISIQRFNSDHMAVGSEIPLFAGSNPGETSSPSITGLSDGGFIVTATRDNGPDVDLWAARYDAAGNVVDLQTGLSPSVAQVVAGGPGNQIAGSVIELQSGELVISYSDGSAFSSVIRARLIQDDGQVDIQLNSLTLGSGFVQPTLSPLKQGGFVAAWNSTDFFNSTIDVQFFDVNGVASGPTVNLGSTQRVNSPASVTVLENNQVAVVWSESTFGNPLGNNRISGAILNTDGSIDNSGVVPIAHVDSIVGNPDVIALSDGGFLVAYSDESIDGSPRSIVAQRFDADFADVGVTQPIGANTNGTQTSPELLQLPESGQIVAIWNTDNAGSGLDVAGNVYLLESTGPAGQPIPLNLTAEILPGASDSISNLEIRGLESGTRVFATETATGMTVEVFGTPFGPGRNFNLNMVDIDSVEILLDSGVASSTYELFATVNDNGQMLNHTQSLVATAIPAAKTISGTVFNDEGADGLIAGDSGFEEVRVLLYEETAAGTRNQIDAAITDSSGFYNFTGLSEGTYFIVVDSASIGHGFVAASDEDKILAEQTYGGDGSIQADLDSAGRSAGALIGGRFGSRSDDASTLELSEHVIRRTIEFSDFASENADFGFSFNIVTNVEDTFDPNDPFARTSQGSLRQFINNANFIDGPNHMRFVPAVGPNESSDADNNTATGDSWWSINLVDQLQAITSSDTILDGQAFRAGANGLEVLDYNNFSVRNSFSGTVGTNDLAFVQTDAPELEIIGNDTIEHGFEIVANADNILVENVEINNFAIHGFADDIISVRGDDSVTSVTLSGIRIQNNVIGSAPNDLASFVSSSETFRGIQLDNAIDGVISNNILIGNTEGGIRLINESHGWTVVDNELVNNGAESGLFDGIVGTNISDLTIQRNAIHGNYGMGIDSRQTIAGVSNWLIEDNSIFDNGRGNDLEGSGIRLSGNGATVRHNRIFENQFSGVVVTGNFLNAQSPFVPASNNLITENSFRANGLVEIDLAVDPFNGNSFQTVDANSDGFIDPTELPGVGSLLFDGIANSSTNDGLISTSEANNFFSAIERLPGGLNFNDGVNNSNVANEGLDFVDVVSAEFVAGRLELEFEIRNPNVERIELYTTLPGDTDQNSEAFDFFRSVDVASLTNLGGDLYSVSILASDFPAGTALDTPIAALAFDGSNNTSEFGMRATPVIINTAPTGMGNTLTLDEDSSIGFTIGDFGFDDVDMDPFTELVLVTDLSTSTKGSLLLNNVPVDQDDRIPVSSLGDLTYVPRPDFFGNATVQFAVSDGDLDSIPLTITFIVSNVSDAPTGQSDTLTIEEDEVAIFTESTFGFSDPIDGNLDAFIGVWIDNYTGGTLASNSGTVMPGDFVSVGDLQSLEFTPTPNTNGNGIATIDFFVVDSGDAMHNRDLTLRTLTYNVTPVSDAPVGQDGFENVDEDDVLRFDVNSFGFSDPIDGNADSFAGVQIVSFSGSGTLTTDAGDVTANQFISASELSQLTYQAAANEYGPSLAAIVFRVVDTGVTNDTDIADRTLTINVDPVSDAPTGMSTIEDIVEDQIVTFTQSSFGFSDAIDSGPDEDSFASVRIVAFQGSGSLTLNNVDVIPGQVIAAADLQDLEYQPGANETGTAISTIEFTVIDSATTDNEDLVVRTITYNVSPVSDAPTGQSRTIDIDEDSVFNFTESTFGFMDLAEGVPDTFESVRIVSFNGVGTLELDNMAVMPDDVIDVADIVRLEYRPLANQSGDAYATIGFRVIDSGTGSNEDLVTRTLTFDVQPVNDAPMGQSRTIDIDEDEVVSLSPSIFGFSDPLDTVPQPLVEVRIVGFNGGSLTLDMADITPGKVVAADDLNRLRFQPDANQSGVGIASIDFRVIDGGTDNNEDLFMRTLTFNVTPVSDSPAGDSDTIFILEDQAFNSFAADTFAFSDPFDNPQDSFDGVRIVSFVGSGTLTLNNVDIVPGQVVTAAELPGLVYQPGVDDFGPGIATIEFRVIDDGTDEIEDPTTHTLTFDVGATGDAPEGQSDIVPVNEDEVVTFTELSFGFSDTSDNDNFASVRIVGFSGSGTLTFNNVSVNDDDMVDVADLHLLQYQPGANENGNALSTIEFRVIDDSAVNNEDLMIRTLTFDVSAVSDSPTGRSATIPIVEDQPVRFTEQTFGFEDALDGGLDNFASVRIVSFSGSGSLELANVDVVDGTVIDADQLPDLVYQPGRNEHGNGLSTIEFQVIDSGTGPNNEDATVRTLTFDVESRNDDPNGTSDQITINEGETLTFTSSTFGFTDPDDVPADAFAEVRIVDFLGSGRLIFDGNDVSPSDVISVADLSRLEYIPGLNITGSDVSTIMFNVIDDGDTGTGHFNEDTSPNELVISIDNLNDAPEGMSDVVTILEDENYSFTRDTFGFSDPADEPENLFQSVRIVGFSGSGSFVLNGMDVAPNDLIDASDIANLEYRPNENEHGEGIFSVEFRVIDDGATGVGHENEDLTTRTITFDVVSVNDQPTGQDFSIDVDEESTFSFSPSDFQLDDSDDSPAENSLSGIRIIGSTVPGRVTLGGNDLAINSFVPLADISLLALETESVANDTVGQILFTVIDDGGTANAGVSESDEFAIDVLVRQINQAPTILSSRFTNDENTIEPHEIAVSDPDQDSVTLSFAGMNNDNALFEFTPDGRSIQFRDAPDFENSLAIRGANEYVVELVATDSNNSSSPIREILVNVGNEPEAVLLADDITTLANSSTFSLFDNDNRSAPLPAGAEFGVLVQPSFGFIEINPDGTFAVTMNAGAPSVASFDFTYFVNNGGEITTANVSVFDAAPVPDSGSPDNEQDNSPDDSSNDDSEDGTDIQGPANPNSNPQEDMTPENAVQPRVFAVNNSGANTLNNDISFNEFGVDIVEARPSFDSNYLYSGFVDTGLLTPELVSRVFENSRSGLQDFNEEFVLAAIFWNELESASHEFIETEIGQIESVIAVGALGFTSVAVGLFTRAVLLGLSLGATYSQPWWMTSFDFLPIVDSEDEESIGQIVDHQT